ncbi:hypothetical protein GW950_00305 [Candidatus Wolfebacteria bacterium]|nr:hypothetical protein [Candidatus Wolfebacteria bacterium]
MPKPPPEPSGKNISDLFVLGAVASVILPFLGVLFLWAFQPLEFLMSVREFFAPFIEDNLIWLELVAIILSAIFIWATVSMIIKTGYLELKREQFLDHLGEGKVSKRRPIRAWNQIQERLLSEDQNDWRLSILEANKILDEVLKMSGHIDPDTKQKLENVSADQLSNIEDVKVATNIAYEIAKNPTYEITIEKTQELIEIYKKAFIELNLIED